MRKDLTGRVLGGRLFTGWVLGLWLLAASVCSAEDGDMAKVKANGVSLAYTEIGASDGPAVLMIMGLGSSHKLWGDELPRGLANAGYRVILMDNRDVGDSQRMDAMGDPWLRWQLLKNAMGFSVDNPYSVQDMAADAAGLLDAIGVEKAHIVGASLGGVIAQVFAVQYPNKTLSLVSVMSTSGAEDLPEPTPEARKNLEAAAFADDEDPSAMHDRGFYPEGVPRQMLAFLASGDRSAELRKIQAPTLVLHGAEDGLLPPAHGEHTAQLIPAATLQIVPGMGHNLPEEAVPELVASMVSLFRQVTPTDPSVSGL